MAIGTTAAILGAAVIGGAATVYGVQQTKKANKEQTARLDQQEADAKTAIQEEALANRNILGQDNAIIKLGRNDGSSDNTTTTTRRTSKKKTVKGKSSGLSLSLDQQIKDGLGL